MIAQGEDTLAYLDRAITATERTATEAAAEYGTKWYYDDGFILARREDDMVATGSQDFLERPQGEHIALHDPESVLRRCAADRKLIAEHQEVPNHGRYSEPECPADCDGQHDDPPVCRACRDYAGDPLPSPCRTVRYLAEAYGWTEGAR